MARHRPAALHLERHTADTPALWIADGEKPGIGLPICRRPRPAVGQGQGKSRFIQLALVPLALPSDVLQHLGREHFTGWWHVAYHDRLSIVPVHASSRPVSNTR